MKSIPLSEATENLAELVNQVAYGERVVIKRHGERVVIKRHEKPAAVLVSVEDLELLEALEDHIDGEAAMRVLESGEEPVSLAEAKKILERP